MSKKKIIRITVCSPNKETFRRFQLVRNFHCAKKWARRMGAGAVIQRLESTRSGKLKVYEWEYVP